MVLRSVSYFRERDQGHDHVTHGDRGRGRGQVGQAHVGVNGIVKDEGRGEIIQSGCSRRCLIKCTLIFYCTNPSVHLYSCIILSTETSHGMISNDFHWLRWEMVFTWLGMLYPEIRGIFMYVDHWILLCRERDRWGTRVFGRWSRHRQLANILSDPVQIQCHVTSCGKACSLPKN